MGSTFFSSNQEHGIQMRKTPSQNFMEPFHMEMIGRIFLNHLHLKPIQTNTSCINVWGDHFSYHSYDQKGVPNRGWFLTIGSAFGSLTVASFTHRSWKTRHRSVWHQRGKKGI